MSSELTQYFQSIIQNLLFSQKSDILREIDFNSTTEFQEIFTKESAFKPIFAKSKKIEKETGINPLCKSYGIILLKELDGNLTSTPILLKELKVRFEANKYYISEIGDYFINPFLIYLFKINLINEIKSLDEFKNLDCTANLNIDESICLIGNFHPYRFEVFRDLSEISRLSKISKDLATILMMEKGEVEFNFDWNIKPILQLDYHQRKALEKIKSNSVVVHGPPGTGKSQLIGNTIASALNSNLSILLSSEKKASLDAVYKRLEKVGLHRFCLVNYTKNENKLLIQDLKKTWDYLNKDQTSNYTQFDNNNSFTSLINEFISKPKIEGVPIKDLVSKLEKSDFAYSLGHVNFNEIKENEDLLNSIKSNYIELVSKLNFNQHWDENRLISAITEFEKLIELISPYHIIQTINDLDQLVKNLLVIQGFSSALFQKYGELICKKTKKIKRLYTESINLEKNNSKWEGLLNHWLKIPSEKEIDFIKQLASKKGLFDRIKFKKTWKKWVRTTELDPISTCDEMLGHLAHTKQKNRFLIELTELGIESINDLKLINDLANNHSAENWNWYLNLNDELKRNYKNVHNHVSHLKMLLTRDFNFKKADNIRKLVSKIKDCQNSILQELSIIEKLPNSLSELLQKCSSLNEFFTQVYLSLWKSNFGNLEIPTKSTQKEWIKSAVRYEKNKVQISKKNALELIEGIKIKFDSYHKLIETPNRKLNSEEQILKAELKIGKSILVKEFGKVKQHLNFRKLYESEAKKWLLVLKPILMMHPLRIATYFPPEPGLFDLGIIDEASQMPFKNAIGTLQRVKRILIAGDENQMDPSFFFSSNNNEHSVFHQAKYHLKNIELTHHYRSESEELIAFSNRYFYDNKLRFIEKSNPDKKRKIEHHFVTNGNYNDGVNENEAQELSNYLIKRLENNSNEMSIGIVAFSEAQLASILQKIPSPFLKITEELEDSNRLFFKTLDQVQGDECDVLIVSFGYGKNKEGNFEMRFGPINQQGGEKRLNVLFSRAKKEIHFFSSAKFHDFPQTKNDSINLLRSWFAILEDTKNLEMKKYEINIFDIMGQAKDADDFTHLISIYHDRGWEILTT